MERGIHAHPLRFLSARLHLHYWFLLHISVGSCYKHRISKYWTICSQRRYSQSGCCEPLVTFLSTSPFITLLYVFRDPLLSCTHYWFINVEPRANSTTRVWGKLTQHPHFPCKAQGSLPASKNAGQYFGSAVGGVPSSKIASRKPQTRGKHSTPNVQGSLFTSWDEKAKGHLVWPPWGHSHGATKPFHHPADPHLTAKHLGYWLGVSR